MWQYDLQKLLYPCVMTYGDRLFQAMSRRSEQLGRKVGRVDVANVAGCSRQNIGMIITGAQGPDQKLSTESHAKVADYLKVNANWLLYGIGSMDDPATEKAKSFTPFAELIATEFDKIPASSGSVWASAYSNILQIIALAQQSLKPANEQPQGLETLPAPLQSEPAKRKSRV